MCRQVSMIATAAAAVAQMAAVCAAERLRLAGRGGPGADRAADQRAEQPERDRGVDPVAADHADRHRSRCAERSDRGGDESVTPGEGAVDEAELGGHRKAGHRGQQQPGMAGGGTPWRSARAASARRRAVRRGRRPRTPACPAGTRHHRSSPRLPSRSRRPPPARSLSRRTPNEPELYRQNDFHRYKRTGNLLFAGTIKPCTRLIEIPFVAGHPALDFLNTAEERGHPWAVDTLVSPADLWVWGQRYGLLAKSAEAGAQDRAEMRRARQARELLYAIFFARVHDRPVPPDALDRLGQLAAAAYRAASLQPGEDGSVHWHWDPADLATVRHVAPPARSTCCGPRFPPAQAVPRRALRMVLPGHHQAREPPLVPDERMRPGGEGRAPPGPPPRQPAKRLAGRARRIRIARQPAAEMHAAAAGRLARIPRAALTRATTAASMTIGT